MEINYYNFLLKNQLSPNQHYILHCFKNNIRTVLINNIDLDMSMLKAAGFLTNDLKLTEKSEIMLDSVATLFKKTQGKNVIDLMGADYLTKITQYRSLFPKNKKSTPAEVKVKFAKLFYENPQITWDILLKGTQLYFSEERDEKYIYKASNFIMVQRNGINTYPILEYYERIEEGEDIQEKADVNMYKIY
jgi:hypothetical protein